MPAPTTWGLQRRAQYFAARARIAAANLISTGNIHGDVVKHPADFAGFVARQGGRQSSDQLEIGRASCRERV